MPTATISGKVTADGTPLPGVTITATSPNLQGARTVVTTPAGDYIIPFLPPGDYSITYELQGMQTITRRMTLTAARNERVDIALKPASISESITVTAETPVTASLESPTISTNFKQQEFFEKLPVLRNLTNIALMAPGTNSNAPGSAIVISGSFSYDNLFLINGAIVNENLRGQPRNLVIEDAIQETTVMTGAVPAEYGHFTGGVVNYITRSGGNDFSGSIRDNVTSEGWNSKTKFTVDQSDDINHTFEGTLGGPFLRDRLWFFGAGRYLKTSAVLQTSFGTVRTGDQDVHVTTYPQDDKATRAEAKLTAAITPQHNIVASYVDLRRSITNTSDATPLNLDVLNPEEHTPESLAVLNYSGVLTKNLFLEAQGSRKEMTFADYGARCFELLCGTRISDRGRGASYNSPVFRWQPRGEQRDHKQYSTKGTYYLSTANYGSHQLKTGYEYFWEDRNVNNYQGGSDYTLSINSTIIRGDQIFPRMLGGAGSTQTRITWQPIFVLSKGSEYVTHSAFLSDGWDLNSKWQFNVGVRWDKNDAISGDHSFTIAKDSLISPRLNAQYDIFGTGRLVFNAGYAKYVGRLAEGVGNDGDPAGRTASITWFYRGPSINNDVNAPTSSLIDTRTAMKMVFDWFFAQGGTNSTPTGTITIPGVNTVLDSRGLRAPSVKEWTFGSGGRLGPNSFFRADIVYRDWDDFYTSFTNTQTGKTKDRFGNTYDLSVIRNANIHDRKYIGLQSQASWRPTQKLNIGGVYTWSKQRGDVLGENSANGPFTEGGGDYPEYFQPSWNNPTGFLTEDQRHRLRAWAQYDIPTRIGLFNVSLLQNFDSGIRTSSDDTIDLRGYVTNPGYVNPPIQATYYFHGRGDLKHDDITRTDFALNYSYKLGQVELFFQPEIINLFNEQGVVSFNEEIFTSLDPNTGLKQFNPFTEKPIECPQGAPASQCSSMGAHWQKGPNFGKPTAESSFQQTRTIRFSIGVRF
jgi:outer membrane receptor for ferrienterochelin and colicin